MIRLIAVTSIAACVAALVLPGWSDLALLAGPCAIASVIVLLRRGPTPAVENRVVIDGSNVMYWKDNTPQIETVREVVDSLTRLGFTPGVIFDANAGYLVSDRYRHDGHWGRVLNLPKERVMVVPKGTPADPAILLAARDLGARVVTNDRFRDWKDAHPEVEMPGHLIRGGYRSGALWLDVDDSGDGASWPGART